MLRNCCIAFITAGLAGCSGTTAKPAVASEKPKVEADLAFTNLTKKAYVSLAIKTRPAVVKDVQQRLALTGWIMAKPGNEVVLTAPTAGYVRFAKGRHAPIAGETVKPKQELLQLDPVLSPVEAIQVAALKRGIEADFVKAQTTLKNAQIEFKRAEELEKVRSKQEYEQAQKALAHAKEELAAAKDKLAYFETQKITLVAPQAGTILQLHAGPGQYVPVSAPLITIIDLNPIWLRVPIPEVDLASVDPKAGVSVVWRNGGAPTFLRARPTGRVAQVDPLKHTAEIWYELETVQQPDRFVKDQMVAVQVPIGKEEKATVLPYSAIVFDAHGHAWIYLERTTDKDDKHQFERRPVELVGAEDAGVIIRTSLSGGEPVVTNGAGALFSRDFHKTPVPED